MLKKANFICIFIFMIILLLSGAAEAKSINTFIIRISGNSLRAGDEVHLAKHDIIFANRFHYDDIRGDSWGEIKDINPNAEIYLYSRMHLVNRDTGSNQTLYLNELGRYSVSRGHSMGSLNGNNPGFFLLDKNGNRIRMPYNDEPNYWLDFGNTSFQNYSIEAIVTDFANTLWTADGFYSDQAFLTIAGTGGVLPAKYDTDAKWADAMKSMILATSGGLHAENQNFAGNSGPTYNSINSNSWIDMDRSSNHPDVLLDEGAFAVKFGGGDIQFYNESRWLNTINVLSSLENIKACFNASCELAPDQSGIDNWGKSFTFWDAFYYVLGSYLLGKNDVKDTAYIQFDNALIGYGSANQYYDEYDKIDLGDALSDHKIRSFSGNNIYWREYEEGYVYVNPTNVDISSISLPESCKKITHSNLNTDPDNLPSINSINLKAHRAAILYKADISDPPPPPPPPVSDSLIMDNGDPGTSSTGSWPESGATDYYGSESLYSREAGATYTFQASANGLYEVSLWWTQWASRDPSVPVSIYDGNTILDTVWINQTQNEGQWNTLGSYEFSSTAKIVIESETTNYSTCADAVMFSPLNTGIIIDNGDPGTSSTGSWPKSGATDYYGSESLYSREAGATYTFQASANGLYEVSLWWTQWASRDPSVPVSIYDGNIIIDKVWIDQTQNGGQWNTLGSYEFSSTAKVVIESETTNYSTGADAVMFSQ